MSLTKSNTRMLEGDIDASNITGVLPVANGGTGSSTGASAAVFSESFESSEQTVANGAMSIEVAHGLGSVPKVFQVVARCKTTEGGYAVGDEILIADSRRNISTHGNATNVGLVSADSLFFMNKTASTDFEITAANWKLVFRAFA